MLCKTSFLAGILTSLLSSSEAVCPDTWVDGSLVSMGCLLFHTEGFLTWDDASAFCLTQHERARLVAIETEQEMEFMTLVLGFLGHHNWWTSGLSMKMLNFSIKFFKPIHLTVS